MRYTVKIEEDWHSLREQYITASESAVLIGQNPYSSPSKLKKSSDFVGNAYTFVGQVLEPVVVDITNRLMGTDFRLYETENDGKVFFTKGKLGATPDAFNFDNDNDWLLECKSTKPDSFVKYKKVPPSNYLVQLQTQLWCTDKAIGYLSILSTDLSQRSQKINWPIVIYKVARNDELCTIINTEAERFYTTESFRVSSSVKKRCTELLDSCYEVTYVNTEAEDNKSELRALMSFIK